MDNIEAKTVKLCDNCKSSLTKDDDKGERIEATLNNSQQKTQKYDFCSEECLRQFLNGRAKRKVSKASIVFDINTKFRK